MSRKLIVNGNYICNNNNLKELQGAPKHIGGDLFCSYNKNLSKQEIIKYKETGTVKGDVISDYIYTDIN